MIDNISHFEKSFNFYKTTRCNILEDKFSLIQESINSSELRKYPTEIRILGSEIRSLSFSWPKAEIKKNVINYRRLRKTVDIGNE